MTATATSSSIHAKYNNDNQLVVSLTDTTTTSVVTNLVSPSRVGGKASSLARLYATKGLGSRVPKAYALTVDFFQPWIDELKQTETFQALHKDHSQANTDKAKDLCSKLQATCLDLAMSEAQSNAIRSLCTDRAMTGIRLAAVRSSAPEEDGSGASFAGAFETKLGVVATYDGLETAIRDCFASLWGYRVLMYKQKQKQKQQSKDKSKTNIDNDRIGFAIVVMEMVDSVVAGVAFSANPLNSDRDEVVIESSWGLGESVVDGSVTADRYVVDKITNGRIIEEILGEKGQEKRLITSGGVESKSIEEEDPRYSDSSLNHQQIKELSELVCLVETTYGMPMDVEWAFVIDDVLDVLKIKLLQARPITTLYSVDPEMMTQPGEKRLLYFDSNVASEATTTTPFTTMDLDCMNSLFTAMFYGGDFGDEDVKKDSYFSNKTDPRKVMYNGSTRQYYSMNWVFKWFSKESFGKMMEPIDPYISSIVRSKDYNVEKYQTWWIPTGFSYTSCKVFTRWALEMGKVNKKYKKDPKGAKEVYLEQLAADMERFHKIAEQDSDNSTLLLEYSDKLLKAILPILNEETSPVMGIVSPLFSKIDKERRNGKTDKIKEQNEALCGGFEGDRLMEMNTALYRLAHTFPMEIWKDYDGEHGMIDLAERIQEERDLPHDFLSNWKSFLGKYGFDGQDQLFVGCPRYVDSPWLLLQKMKLTAIGSGKDPSKKAKKMLEKRRAMMAKQEADALQELKSASCWNTRSMAKKVAEIQNRNEILDHLMWMRNSPKLHMTEFIGAIRAKVLTIEETWIAEGRLEEKGDIFHLEMAEVDQGLVSSSENSSSLLDLMTIIRPRKKIYERVVSSNMCPVLVDSRCRILQPDPPTDGTDPGTLVGTAISPGVATGKVRIVNNLSVEQTHGFGMGGSDGQTREDHVLCAVVTGPAWTPLFASASAVVLQVGGVLQHGALCAREYGKPAVSNIHVHKVLKDGMTISVDGNTGIVTILDGNSDDGKKE